MNIRINISFNIDFNMNIDTKISFDIDNIRIIVIIHYYISIKHSIIFHYMTQYSLL